MTFAEFALLVEQYRGQQERLDRRAALGAGSSPISIVTAKPVLSRLALRKIVSWLGHGFQRRETPPVAQSARCLHDERLQVFQVFYSENGQG